MFGGFKETKESNETKENDLDKVDKRRNQIIEIPDEYKDDFDSKIDANENNKEKKFSGENNNGEKKGFIGHVKELFKKPDIEDKKQDTEDKKQDFESRKSARESFYERLKVPSPEEVKKYNEEHGYVDEPAERPKGGVERVRVLGGDDPRWWDYESSETEKNTDQSDDKPDY